MLYSFLISGQSFIEIGSDSAGDINFAGGPDFKSISIAKNATEDSVTFKLELHNSALSSNYEIVIWINSDNDITNGLMLSDALFFPTDPSPNQSMKFDSFTVLVRTSIPTVVIQEWAPGSGADVGSLNFSFEGDSTLYFSIATSDLDHVDNDGVFDLVLASTSQNHGGFPDNELYDYMPDDTFITVDLKNINSSTTSNASDINIDSVSQFSLCAMDTILAYFTADSFESDNDFNLILSDATGIIDSGSIIGSVHNTSSDTIVGLIPKGVVFGEHYKVVLKSTHPIKTSNEIMLTSIGIEKPFLGNDTSICEGDSLLLNPKGTYWSYLWSDNSEDSSFWAFESGSYDVQVKNNVKCTSSDSINIEIISCETSLYESGASSDFFFVYPNPFNDEVVISTSVHNQAIQILNSLGKVIVQASGDGSSKFKIDLKKQPSGVYFLRYYNGQELIKMIKK